MSERTEPQELTQAEGCANCAKVTAAYDALAAKLAQAERKILGAKEYQRAIEQALDGANSECARLTRELETKRESIQIIEGMRLALLEQNAALREVAEAAKVLLNENYATPLRTALAALAKLEEEK